MKIRNHRKYEWWFRPSKLSKFEKNLYRFKYKSDLIKFLNKNFEESINGTVSLDHKSFNSSNTIREWFVWYNDYDEKGSKLKIELRQLLFRGRKVISKNNKISKEDKKLLKAGKLPTDGWHEFYQKQADPAPRVFS